MLVNMLTAQFGLLVFFVLWTGLVFHVGRGRRDGYEQLADAIHPGRTEEWTTDRLAKLARAHRADSERIDEEAVEFQEAVVQAASEIRRLERRIVGLEVRVTGAEEDYSI